MVVGIDWIKECFYKRNRLIEELQSYLIEDCGFTEKEAYIEAKRRVLWILNQDDESLTMEVEDYDDYLGLKDNNPELIDNSKLPNWLKEQIADEVNKREQTSIELDNLIKKFFFLSNQWGSRLLILLAPLEKKSLTSL